jgi:hypothetical protein
MASSKAQAKWGLGTKRKGHTHIMSYQKATNFKSAGTKRAGDNKYMDRPDAPRDGMNPGYAGGTDDAATGMIPE